MSYIIVKFVQKNNDCCVFKMPHLIMLVLMGVSTLEVSENKMVGRAFVRAIHNTNPPSFCGSFGITKTKIMKRRKSANGTLLFLRTKQNGVEKKINTFILGKRHLARPILKSCIVYVVVRITQQWVMRTGGFLLIICIKS